MLELAREKEELFKKIQTLKEKNSKLENANRQVQSKISGMISTYNQFLEKIS
jgi:chaperonin cofactor prefoldin